MDQAKGLSVHPGLECLKVISVGKDRDWERIPFPWSHGDKQIGE